MTQQQNAEQQSPAADWCKYDPNDTTYHGAKKVVEAERAFIRKRRADAAADNLTGLALSGGGIRSASFSLGVMQALARTGRLKRFDYLSTVSGGGYIGSSLTWLLHKPWNYNGTEDKSSDVQFGLDADMFPFKTEPVWSTQTTAAPSQSPSAATPNTVPAYVKGSMLRWLRQNGKFLTPGGCHNFMALTAVVLRGTLLSVLVYLSMLVLLFMGLNGMHVFSDVRWDFTLADCGGTPAALIAAAWGGALFAVLALAYSLTTFCSSVSGTASSTDRGCNRIVKDRYCWRRRVECGLGILLAVISMLVVIGALPLIPAAVQTLYELDDETKNKIATAFSVVSALAGIGSSIGIFAQSNARKKSKWMPLLTVVAAALLLFGVLLLAYQIAVVIGPKYPGYLLTVTIVLVVSGWFTNLNYISVHRYYRDRLMETFMPDVADAVTHAGSRPGAAPEADRTRIQDTCGGDAGPCGPYHLINTNIVLVESKRPKFKGRGGDNFILSPHYCGSNATGWRRSNEFMDGGMTLATAMAISGAAVNPSAGCGGDGVTRQPIMSTLMGLLNIRLGYWAPNPDPERQPLLGKSPNFLWPGLWELVLRKSLNEDKRFIQLSDGGHFENLGLYELLRRRLKVIVVCDGGADPDYTFSDLANAIEKARADFGALINIECKDLQPLVARVREQTADGECPEKFAECGHLVADIHYADNSHGTLIYLTTTFTKNLSADLYGYRKEHPEFPDEPTGDQFFDEKQFEAYRELGFQLAWKMIEAVPNWEVEQGSANT
ncbi:MAG: patatin-like phospholipase family protein [Gammaproteobacteria bacterium]|nr:patatin-like phospholipase family protein [Gammaproteobacteria bacterium]